MLYGPLSIGLAPEPSALYMLRKTVLTKAACELFGQIWQRRP